MESIISLAGITAGTICLLGIGSIVAKEAFRTWRKSLALKKTLSDNKAKIKRIECLEFLMKAAIGEIKKTAR